MTEPQKKKEAEQQFWCWAYSETPTQISYFESSSRSITMSIEGLLYKNKFDIRNIILVVERNVKKSKI